MTQKRYASELAFSRYLHKESRKNVYAIKVTDENIEVIHKLWKTPSATVGAWFVRIHANKKQVLTTEQFDRLYRLP
jgi:hypothetical protein